jgi:hypothetical protein
VECASVERPSSKFTGPGPRLSGQLAKGNRSKALHDLSAPLTDLHPLPPCPSVRPWSALTIPLRPPTTTMVQVQRRRPFAFRSVPYSSAAASSGVQWRRRPPTFAYKGACQYLRSTLPADFRFERSPPFKLWFKALVIHILPHPLLTPAPNEGSSQLRPPCSRRWVPTMCVESDLGFIVHGAHFPA